MAKVAVGSSLDSESASLRLSMLSGYSSFATVKISY